MAFAGTIAHPQSNISVVSTSFKSQEECLWVLLRGDAHHDNPDADVVVVGHVHERWFMELPRERLHTNNKYAIKHDKQHHVRTGTYKDEYRDGAGGWHIERGGPPKAVGAIWMKLKIKRGTKLGNRTMELVPEFSYAD